MPELCASPVFVLFFLINDIIGMVMKNEAIRGKYCFSIIEWTDKRNISSSRKRNYP